MQARPTGWMVGAAVVAGVLLLGGSAMAQQEHQGTPGVTSGAAVGTPPTLGTGGEVPASPHQLNTTKHRAKAVHNEHRGQAGGSGSSKVKAERGTEAGKPPVQNDQNKTQ
jgi:hypothetical protein